MPNVTVSLTFMSSMISNYQILIFDEKNQSFSLATKVTVDNSKKLITFKLNGNSIVAFLVKV